MSISRRDMFKSLAAALVAAAIPLPVEEISRLKPLDIIAYLNRVRDDILYQITHPAMVMDEKGAVTLLSTQNLQDCLTFINATLQELGYE